MNALHQMIEEPQVLPTFAVMGILAWVGSKMIVNRPDIDVWGYRCAAAAFLGFSLYGAVEFGVDSASDVLWILVRALLFAGVALGASWICLAALDFGYSNTWARVQEKNEIRRAECDRKREERKAVEERRSRDRKERRQDRGSKRSSTPKEQKCIKQKMEDAYSRFDEERALIESHEKDPDKANARIRFAEKKLDRTVQEILG